MMEQTKVFRPWVLQPMPLGMNCKPWYLDKLPSKCLAKHKNRIMKFPTSLNSQQWVFVKEGLDDFRKGCLPCEGLITRGPKESFLPMISHKCLRPAPKTSQRKLSKDFSLFSTLSQSQLARKAFVEDMEAHLTQHPLASYPNLEDLPADLLLKVLQVLDSERELEDAWAYCEGDRERTREPMKLCKHRYRKAFLGPPKTPVTYPEDLTEEEETSSSKDELPESPPTTTYIPSGIHDFCKWVATFGDGDLGIDEEFVMKQFEIKREDCKSNYEDLQRKTLNEVCSDLKFSVGLSKMEEIKFSIEKLDIERKLQKPPNPYKPKWVKMRYGAWYLKPKLWKKLINDEPLIDPKVILEAEARLSKPDILDDLYGTIAFKDFIMSKGYRMPGFLEKLFHRKGWTYESVKTPIPHVVNTYSIIGDDPSEND
ncbi:protein FAM47E-like [Nycticebus coucang]|uniref:protein FAM47E-like n=1 Tax=Nycticebus coucang TaxID=9470 RepID=UPI00234C514C|nr:protein FAM47E-like [Nycticebus coucang]